MLRELRSVRMEKLHAALCMVVVFSVVYIFAFANYFGVVDIKDKVTTPEGLKTKGRNFTLRKKPFRIMSGSLHYFRIPHHEWGNRLSQMKTMGLNTVDIYIPWNLHEPTPGNFNFEDSAIRLAEFLGLLSSYELYGIVRPGPYICSEWDLGGLPSWLLRDKDMKLRSMYPGFVKAVNRYFDKLLPLLKEFQFSYGGPIIAFQIENEYGVYGNDVKYMTYLKNLFKKHELEEFLFVCDNEDGLGKYKLDGVLQTINLMSNTTKKMIKKLLSIQPDKPVFVTELWDGWFDHWGEKHHTVDTDHTISALEDIIHEGGSFNLYMWHGGTSFGFMNGANARDDGSNYQCDVTSYDYNAPLSETGDETKKYQKLKYYIGKKITGSAVGQEFGAETLRGFTNYGEIDLTKYLTIDDVLDLSNVIKQDKPSSMEMLNTSKDYAQAYGYVVYQTKLKHGGKSLKIINARDFSVILLNKQHIYTSKSLNELEITVQVDGFLKRNDDNILQIVVENCGRVNYGKAIDNQRKGILGSVFIDGKKVLGWEIFSLDFQLDWVRKVSKDKQKWRDFDANKSIEEMKVPLLFKGNLFVHSFPRQTFITLPGWFKGVVFVNGVNIGRYWNIGPQKTLFVPAQFLKSNNNEVLVFDFMGLTKKYESGEFPMISSTNEQDLGKSVSFLI